MERRVHVQGSATWLSRQALKNNQTRDQPSLHRTLSAPPTPAATDTPRVAHGFPEWSAQCMRNGPDLDVMYGSAQPPRAKPGKASGIQKLERNEKDGMVIVHPGRIVLEPAATPELSAPLQEIRDKLHARLKKFHDKSQSPAYLQEEDDKFLANMGEDHDQFLARLGIEPDKFLPRLGEDQDQFFARLKDVIRTELMDEAAYKWNIAENGQLMLGKSKFPGGKKLGWGHPTLVGGLKEP